MGKNSNLLVDLGQGLSLMLGLTRIASWDTPSRPKKPRRGIFGFNSQTNSLEYYNGNYWLAASMSEV